MQYNIKNFMGATFSSLPKGADALLLGHLAQGSDEDIVYIASDGVELANMASLVEYMYPKLKVLRFPAWDTVPYDRVSPSSSIISQRIDCLSELALNPNSKSKRVIITSVGAVLQKLPPSKIFLNSIREVSVGNKLIFDDFLHYVSINGYNRVAQVYEPGEWRIAEFLPFGEQAGVKGFAVSFCQPSVYRMFRLVRLDDEDSLLVPSAASPSELLE